MNRDDIQKLLGGYATGTLTAEEQQVLFEAALNDQELFDALAREQSLRDLLRDPAAKAQLLAALDERPARWYQRFGWWRPAAAVLTMAGVAAVAVVLVRQARPPQPLIIAQVDQPPASPVTRPSSERESTVAAPAEAKPVEAQLAKRARNEVLSDQVNRPVESGKLQAPAVEEDRRASLDKKEAASTPSPEPVVSATPMAAPAPLRSNAIAGFRDTSRGGSGGGSVAPGVGGAPGGAPGAPPQPRAMSESVQVQAGTGAVDAMAVANARELFYGTPPQPAFMAAPATQQQQQPAPLQQQQGQQGAQQAQAVVQLGAASKALQARQVANLGVRYRLLRKTPSGEFAEADPESLKTGDTVKVELTANENGVLSVTSGSRNLFTRQVQKLTTYTTEPLNGDERELSVRFARPTPVTLTGTAVFERRRDEPATNIQPVAAERATYVVADPAAPVVRFTISLKYK